MRTQLPPPKEHSPQFLGHVCCGQTAGRIKMPFGTEVGLGPGDIVLDGEPTPTLRKGEQQLPPNIRPMYCGQTAGWIKMQLGTQVSLGPGDIVLDGSRPHLKHGSLPPPIRVLNQNSISISSAISAQITLLWQTDRQTNWQTNHTTGSVTTRRNYVRSTAMCPNDTKSHAWNVFSLLRHNEHQCNQKLSHSVNTNRPFCLVTKPLASKVISIIDQRQLTTENVDGTTKEQVAQTNVVDLGAT